MLKALLALAVAAAAASTSAQEGASPAMAAARAALVALAQKPVEGFASTDKPWRFSFPADHGAHAQHRTESWRMSGSLATREGRRFGFLLVFLRVSVTPPATALGPSAWAARDVYWAQFVLTDAAADRRYEFEKLERAAMDLSGAQPSPRRVWVHEWSLEVHDAARFGLRAAQEGVSIELSLAAAKAPVTRTASPEPPTVANTFHGYLLTRLHAKGRLQIGERAFEVDGIAWLDRAWGQVPLPVGAVVWDRILVQLADGRDVMGVRLRRRDGSGGPTPSALLVERDGVARTLHAPDLAIDRLERRWRLRMRAENLEFHLDPHVGASGAARVSGSGEGHGWIELAPDGPR